VGYETRESKDTGLKKNNKKKTKTTSRKIEWQLGRKEGKE
jgi:hypothetical protein